MPACSTPFCFLDLAPGVYVVNNTWNTAGATGSQSITVSSATAWTTVWDWTRPETNVVTSYAYAGRGWNYGVGWYYPPAQTGLPLAVATLPQILGTTVYSLLLNVLRGPQIYDISYDIWFHTQALPASNDASAMELMIVLAESAGLQDWRPPTAIATIDGHSWKVFRNSAEFYTFSPNGPQ